jgi:transcription factor TFIIIB component B''
MMSSKFPVLHTEWSLTYSVLAPARLRAAESFSKQPQVQSYWLHSIFSFHDARTSPSNIMSSMIKKKGTLTFKPKAPQSRRQPGAPPSGPSSTRLSIERQSQTPASTVRPTAFSPPPALPQQRGAPHKLPSHQDATIIGEAAPAASSRTGEDSDAADTSHAIDAHTTKENYGIEDSAQVRGSRDEIIITGGDGNSSTSLPTPATVPDPAPLGPPSISHHVAEPTITNATISQDLSVPGNADLSVMGPEESIRAAEVVPTAELNPDGTSGAVVAPVLGKTTKRPSKRRKLDKNGVEIRQSIEVQINKPRRVASGLKKPRRPRDKDGEGTKRKHRAETPDDAEDQEIDHSTVKMADLTKDLRIGKKFSRHAEIKKRDMEKKMKAKLARDHPELLRGQANADEARSQSATREEPPADTSTGPQMRIVNGQIVIDDASLVVDRHARAAAATTDMEEVEEDDFTRITTSGTHLKREMNIYWDTESTEKFYNGIRMFGTDFEMISKMFPDRNRRQIKLKFNKEEREFPKKISNALIGEAVKIDLEEYKLHTGLEYEATDDINAEHAQLEADHKAEQLRLQAEAEETTRQKRAEIQASANPKASSTALGTEPAAGTDSAKENEPVVSGVAEGGKASAASKPKKKAAAKRKRKNPHGTRVGGEEVEVLGTIDDLQT